MKRSREGKRSIIILMVVFLTGLGIFSYPFVSNWISERRALMMVGEYQRNMSYMPEEELEEMLAKAVAYNNALIGVPVQDPFIQGSGIQLPKNYLEILDVSEIMAYIEIPKIQVSLPIYHGVSEEVLKKGIGHMEGTAFPVGGAGTHCLLTGHTGLPEAELFTNLIKMEIGDQFYINVLKKELVYQVDQIKVIEPDELGSLYTQPGEDYMTLITCTPYGVNSHRLLVRGTRVHQMTKSILLSSDNLWVYILILAVSAILFIILFNICYRDNRKKKQIVFAGVNGESQYMTDIVKGEKR
jgi:sortase A